MKNMALIFNFFLFMSMLEKTSERPYFFAQSGQSQLAKKEITIKQLKKNCAEEKTNNAKQIQSPHIEKALEKNLMIAWTIARTALAIGVMSFYVAVIVDICKSFYYRDVEFT